MKISYQDALAYYRIEGAHPGGMVLTKLIFQNESINHHTKILDAGCGTGLTSSYLAKTFSCDVYAIDGHPEMIEAATRRMIEENHPVTIVRGNIEKLPFPGDSFDYIIAESSTAFTHINKSFQEYFRVLKPGGVLLNIDMAAEERLGHSEKDEIIEFYEMKDVLTEEEWIQAFHMAGFQTVEVLKASSVLEEIEEYTFEENEPLEETLSINYDPKMDDILQKHEQLLIAYGEKLGYRVFRAKKP